MKHNFGALAKFLKHVDIWRFFNECIWMLHVSLFWDLLFLFFFPECVWTDKIWFNDPNTGIKNCSYRTQSGLTIPIPGSKTARMVSLDFVETNDKPTKTGGVCL